MKNNITVTFFSNFLLHHQTPFCEAMVELLGENYKYVATERIPEDRLEMGYRDLSHETSYAVNSYENEEEYQKALDLGKNSDVVIIGSAPDEFIVDRLKENKLTFRYSERFFKRGKWRIFDPRVFLAHFKGNFRYRKKNLHMLCASAYTAPDCRFISSYPNKTYKWGYFPPVKNYDNVDALLQSKKKNSILWCARLIKLKHPEAPLKVAKKLKEAGYDFTLDMIGIGPLENKVRKLIQKYGLQKEVTLYGAMSPEEVRTHMEENEIFLFTSDKNEGWGAVLNESMNSACAVVASSAIGSAPYLIETGKNGFIYKNGSDKDLYEKVKSLIDDSEKRARMGKEAYLTLERTWNAKSASKRLLELIESIQKGEEPKEKDGPCSRD